MRAVLSNLWYRLVLPFIGWIAGVVIVFFLALAAWAVLFWAGKAVGCDW